MPQTEVLGFEGWAKGLNKSVHPSRLQPDELAEAKNILLGPRGELRLRHGQAAFTPFTDAVRYRRIRAVPSEVFQPLPVGGNTRVNFIALKDTNGSIVLVSGNDPDLDTRYEHSIMSSASRDWNIIVMNGLIYLAGTYTNPKEINPLNDPNAPSVTSLGTWGGSADTTTQFPNATAITVAYERVFATVATPTNSTWAKYRLFFTEPLLPKTWKALNYIDIAPDEGTAINVIKQFADQLLVFKDQSVWGVAGKDFTSTANLELFQVSGRIGCSTPDTVVDTGELLVFLDTQSGIHAFDGSTFHNIGASIFDYLQQNWWEPYLYRAHAWYLDNRYFLSVPWSDGSPTGDTEPRRTFVFDFQTEAWTEWTVGWSSVALHPIPPPNSAEPTPAGFYVVGVRSNNLAMSFTGFRLISEDYLSDAGSTISVDVRTAHMSPSGGFSKHRIHQTAAHITTTNVSTVLSLHADYDTDTASASATFDPTSAQEDGVVKRSHALNGSRWRSAQFRITADSGATATTSWQLNSIRLDISSLKSKRGVV